MASILIDLGVVCSDMELSPIFERGLSDFLASHPDFRCLSTIKKSCALEVSKYIDTIVEGFALTAGFSGMEPRIQHYECYVLLSKSSITPSPHVLILVYDQLESLFHDVDIVTEVEKPHIITPQVIDPASLSRDEIMFLEQDPSLMIETSEPEYVLFGLKQAMEFLKWTIEETDDVIYEDGAKVCPHVA